MTFRLLKTPNKGNYYVVNERGEPITGKCHTTKAKGNKQAQIAFTLFNEETSMPLKDAYDSAFLTSVVHDILMKDMFTHDEHGLCLRNTPDMYEYRYNVDKLYAWVRKLCRISARDEMMIYQPYTPTKSDVKAMLRFESNDNLWEYIEEWYRGDKVHDFRWYYSSYSYSSGHTMRTHSLGRLVRGMIEADLWQYAIRYDNSGYVGRDTKLMLYRVPLIDEEWFPILMAEASFSMRGKDGIMLSANNALVTIDGAEKHPRCLALDKIWGLLSSVDETNVALGQQLLENDMWKQYSDEDLVDEA